MSLLQISGLLSCVLLALAMCHLSKSPLTVVKGCSLHSALDLVYKSMCVGHLVLLFTVFLV